MCRKKSHLLCFIPSRELASTMPLALVDYDIDVFPTVALTADSARRNGYDLALLEFSSESVESGLDLVRGWRKAGYSLPIVAISSLPNPTFAVDCFDAGVDDFLRKPFICAELSARIRRLLHRPPAGSRVRRVDGIKLATRPFAFAGATVSPDLTVRFGNGRVERIGPKHYAILACFAQHPGQLVLKTDLFSAAWGPVPPSAGSLDVYLCRLRQLFAKHGVYLGRFLINEKKAGWRVGPIAAASP